MNPDNPTTGEPPFPATKEELQSVGDAQSEALRQDNPTTGEWTVEWLAHLGNANNWLESICDTHNAALADAKTLAYAKGAQDQHGEDKQAIDFAEKQLAAERDKASVERMYEERSDQIAPRFTAQQWNILQNTVKELRSQLAAERKQWQLAAEESHRIIHRKNEELAADKIGGKAMNPDNPTTGKRVPEQSGDNMSPEAHPTTSEWTVRNRLGGSDHWEICDTRGAVVKNLSEHQARQIKHSHNAAIAAERKQWQLAAEESHRIIHRKNEELAAERKIKSTEKLILLDEVAKNQQLREQLATLLNMPSAARLDAYVNTKLAAERKKPKTTEYAQGWDDHVLAARSQIEDLKEQLAAERENNSYSRLHVDLAEARSQLAAAAEALDRVSRACKEELSLPYYKATNTPAVMGTFVALQQITDAALEKIGER